MSRLGAGLLAIAAVLAFLPDAGACQACFGAEDSPLIDGARLGAVVLIGLTAVVQGGFLAFFIHLRKRAKVASRLELDTEWSETQRKEGSP